MILIADSGSTKTDWCVVLNGAVIKRLGTKGINPFFQSEEEIQQKLTASLLPQLPEGKFNAVYFYGAGCTPEKAPVLRRAIADSLPVIGNIKANSDMLLPPTAMWPEGWYRLYFGDGVQFLFLQWKRDRQ